MDFENQELRFQVLDDEAGEPLVVAMEDVQGWNGPITGPVDPVWMLRDGSRLTGYVSSLEADGALLESRLWQPLTVPRELMHAILLRLPENANQRDEWLNRLQQPLDRDRIWTRDGDYVDGTVTRIDTRGRLTLDIDGRAVEIALGSLTAIGFAGTVARFPDEQWEISLRDGCRLRSRALLLTEEVLQVNTAGHRFRFLPIEDRVVANDICGLRKHDSDPFFLTQFTPLNFQHQPLVGRTQSLQINRNAVGGRITHGGTHFEYGLGMLSKSSVVFRLEQPCQALHFGLAIDESSGDHGSVVCRVLTLDNNQQWRDAWVSDEIRGGQPPIFQSVSLDGATAIALTVDYGDQADVLDRVNWIMPVLIRQ
ncbi:MAG: NPCBM/NEW2 domain-containing protein [Pirellulaceae bacterium]